MPRILTIAVQVTIPEGYELDDQYVPNHIANLLKVGQADAHASLDDDDLDNPDETDIAANLIIGNIIVIKPSDDPAAFFTDGDPRPSYRQMFYNMTEEQLDQTPTIFDDNEGEYYPAEVLTTTEDDILDANHVYIKIK